MNKEMRDFLTSLYYTIIAELGLNPQSLHLAFMDDEYKQYTGQFRPDTGAVELNLFYLRTKRDAIFVLAHELRHAYQFHTIKSNKFTMYATRSFIESTFGNFETYNFTPLEFDANTWALGYENKMMYKNEVINENTDNHQFVGIKTLYSMFAKQYNEAKQAYKGMYT